MQRGDDVIYLIGNKTGAYLEGKFLGTILDLNGRLMAVCQSPLGSFFVCHPHSIQRGSRSGPTLSPSKT